MPLSSAAISLAQKAKTELAAQAQEVVSLKQGAGRAQGQLMVVRRLSLFALYWTFLVGFGLILWFAKGAVRF